jgi:membrane-associated PAP2 superfamily phosphatase
MKTANTFYWSFIETLIHNVATIAAIVVGIVQFLVRAYKENGGSEKTRKVIQTVLTFINTNTERLIVQLTEQDPAPVPVAKVAQRRTKRS